MIDGLQLFYLTQILILQKRMGFNFIQNTVLFMEFRIYDEHLAEESHFYIL